MNHNIAESYYNTSKTVVKHIHESGNETVIKNETSCHDGAVIDNRKTALFLSSSIGCPLGCEFCYLPSKNFPYVNLSNEEIILSAKEAILASKEMFKKRYLKISFMGMGDLLLERHLDPLYITQEIFTWALDHKFILGVDGVDVGTSFPKSFDQEMLKCIDKMNRYYFYKSNLPMNSAHNYSPLTTERGRTVVRLFVSLHGDTEVRKILMPHSLNIEELFDFVKYTNYDVIFHMLFFKGINDSIDDIIRLKDIFFYNPELELRVLRYNQCGGNLEESQVISSIINMLRGAPIKFKYQQSPGSEISAACGQFICRRNNG